MSSLDEMKICSISVAPIPSIIFNPVASYQSCQTLRGKVSPAETHFFKLETLNSSSFKVKTLQAVGGITGCKYLNREEKQRAYVQNGWNITGDVFKKDEDGYFWFVARGDDMIISSGYNIAAIEVESVLLTHQDILECAVIGLPDKERGMLVCAHIVLKDKYKASDELTNHIQHWFKEVAAPYKYPRVINYTDSLPKTETGKIQRFKLK